MQIGRDDLEKLAWLALYQTDHQTKQNAEEQLRNLLQQELPLPTILQTHSSTVALAIGATLAQAPAQDRLLSLHLPQVNDTLRTWFRTDGTFHREQGQPLEAHCANTLLKFLGRGLKQVFKDPEKGVVVRDWLRGQEQGDLYRLFIYRSFIEQVASLDPEMNFVPYRALLLNFQNTIIPDIFEAMHPRLMEFCSGLSQGQGRVELSSPFWCMLFELLQEVVSFPYNLSRKAYDEYDLDQKVSFPESIISRIVRDNFLQALYLSTSQLLGFNHYQFFDKCLDCLQKILTVRRAAVPESLLPKFLAINLGGVVELLQAFTEKRVGSFESLERAISCSNMFLDIFKTVPYEVLSQLDLNYETFFRRWVQISYQLPQLLLQTDRPVTAENEVLIAAAGLIVNMAGTFYQLKIETQVAALTAEGYHQFILLLGRKFLEEGPNVQGKVDFASLSQLLRDTHHLLDDPISICTANYSLFFAQLQRVLQVCSQDPSQHHLRLGNVFLILACLLNHHNWLTSNIKGEFLQDSPLKRELLLKPELRGQLAQETRLIHENRQEPPSPQLQQLTTLLHSACLFAQNYSQSPNWPYLTHALILFHDAFLRRMTRCLKQEGETQMENPADLLLSHDHVTTAMGQAMQVSQADLLQSQLHALCQLMECREMSSIQFILSSLQETIQRAKTKFSRESFRRSRLYSDILTLLQQLSAFDLQENSLNWRVLLFKASALLCYDESFDNYRSNLRQAVALVTQPEQHLARVLYDLTGICEGIESKQVFEHFLSRLLAKTNYEELLEKLFSFFSRSPPHLKDVLHLTYLLVKQRKGGDYIQAGRFYHVVKINLRAWKGVLEKIAEDSDPDSDIDLLQQLYLGQREVITGGHINLALLEAWLGRGEESLLSSFLSASLQQLRRMVWEIEKFPDQVHLFYELVTAYVEKLGKCLFNHPDPNPGQQLSLLMEALAQKLSSCFAKVVAEEYSSVLLGEEVGVLRRFYRFLHDCRLFRHRQQSVPHLARWTEQSLEKMELLSICFMLGIHFGPKRDSQLLDDITQLTLDTSRLYPIEAKRLAERTGLSNPKDIQELARIVDCIRQHKEADWIYYQLKDWFKNDNRFSSNDPLADDSY